MADAVRVREDMHPTALENGVALLHPRRPMPQILSQPLLALGCTTSGIPFGGNVPLSDVFFLICSHEDRGHLRVLARLSRLLTAPGFLNGLHEAADARAARELIIEVESRL
jgi:PTS system nitrogen regulatory IIA component